VDTITKREVYPWL